MKPLPAVTLLHFYKVAWEDFFIITSNVAFFFFFLKPLSSIICEAV